MTSPRLVRGGVPSPGTARPTCSCSGERLLAVAWPQTRPMPLGFKVRFGRAGRLGCGIRRAAGRGGDAADRHSHARGSSRSPCPRAGFPSSPRSGPSHRRLPGGTRRRDGPLRPGTPGPCSRSVPKWRWKRERAQGGARGTPRPRTYSSGGPRGPVAPMRSPAVLAGRPVSARGSGWLGPGGGERRARRRDGPGARSWRRAQGTSGLQCPPPDGRAQDGSCRGAPRRAAAWGTRAPFLGRGDPVLTEFKGRSQCGRILAPPRPGLLLLGARGCAASLCQCGYCPRQS